MRALILSGSSDIGTALASHWEKMGWDVKGTYRTKKSTTPKEWIYCNLLDMDSVIVACAKLSKEKWDVLVLAPGSLEPIGTFESVDFDAWERGLQINLMQPLRVLHQLLPSRNLRGTPTVLFFSGGGTNNAVSHYSSYTLSKIALTKMCELLDAEIPDTRFVILGPGLVDTKIHAPTLIQGTEGAKDNYLRISSRLKRGECTPMEDVVACCTWVVTTPSPGIKGRNFSVASDQWREKTLEQELEKDPHMYKLRRHKNAWKL